MPLTKNSGQVFLPGGVQQNSKFEIWPLHYMYRLVTLAKSLIDEFNSFTIPLMNAKNNK